MDPIASQRKGFLGTLIFHGTFVTAFLLFGLKAPFPPPSEQGIMVNFGLDMQGSGNTEPVVNDKEKPVNSPVDQTEPLSKGKLLTQDVEEAPAIDMKKEKIKKETTKPIVIKKQETIVKKEVPVREERKVNTKALYTGRKPDSKNTGGEGITGGKGNQGSPFGSVDSKNHAAGDSRGSGTIDFSLSGRNPQYLEKPEANFKENGDVVIEVTVDSDGKVISAKQGKGSTTQNATLIAAAIKAAMASKFDQKADAEPIQRGTITYHFILK